MQEQALFDKYQEGRHWERHPTVYAERFANFLKEQKCTGLVVDVGCGNGRDIQVFATAGFQTLGVDVSLEEVKLAKQKYPGCNFEVQNAEKLSFQDNTVAAFFMINVIHYVNQKTALRELLRALKPGGYAFIHFNLSITDKGGKVDYAQSEGDIHKLLADFSILKKNVFERVDTIPVKHTHKILEVIVRK